MRPHWALFSKPAGLRPHGQRKHPQTMITLCLCVCRTIPLFVWHRQNWNVVYPHLSPDHEGEMEELTKHGTYVAGFLDHSIHGRTDLYDLFVNGENFSCVIISLFT